MILELSLLAVGVYVARRAASPTDMHDLRPLVLTERRKPKDVRKFLRRLPSLKVRSQDSDRLAHMQAQVMDKAFRNQDSDT